MKKRSFLQKLGSFRRAAILTTAGFLCATAAAVLSSCASSGTGLNLYSYEQEAQQGQEIAAQINKQMKIMHDPTLDRYIKNLGQMMISKGVPDPHFDFTFEVVDSDQVNAFAIPGGHLYVNLALLKEATSEAEVVGVVGHEIGHVLHRHGTKKMTDAMLVQIAAAGTEAALDGSAQAGGAQGKYAGLAVMLFGQAGLLKYGRNAELEADQSGIDILNRTGYDMQALPEFFKKLLQIEKQHGSGSNFLTDLLATHPPTQERIDKCETLIATYPKQLAPKESSPEFEALRKYIAPLKPSKEASP